MCVFHKVLGSLQCTTDLCDFYGRARIASDVCNVLVLVLSLAATVFVVLERDSHAVHRGGYS